MDNKVIIVDYGVGNLFSLCSSFDYIGVEAEVTSDADKIRNAQRIILPGVGAFSDAAKKLRATELDTVIKEEAAKGKPIMGICLGMQMLFDRSFEYGEHEGLGLIKGEVIAMDGVIPKDLKIPHIGWNSLRFPKESHLFAGIPQDSYVYFVHSYYLQAERSEDVAAVAEYGVQIHAAVEHGNICACQFHPEKSGEVGLQILRNFIQM